MPGTFKGRIVLVEHIASLIVKTYQNNGRIQRQKSKNLVQDNLQVFPFATTGWSLTIGHFVESSTAGKAE